MEQIVPVNIRNSTTGKVWYANPLTYGSMGRGETPEKALEDLQLKLRKEFPGESFDFRIQSARVNFPAAKSAFEFFEWMNRIQAGEPNNAVR